MFSLVCGSVCVCVCVVCVGGVCGVCCVVCCGLCVYVVCSVCVVCGGCPISCAVRSACVCVCVVCVLVFLVLYTCLLSLISHPVWPRRIKH